MSITLGMQQYPLRTYDGGYEAAFEALKSIGIDRVEPWYGAFSDNPEEGMSISSMRALMTDTGIGVICGHLTVDEYDARRDEWVSFLKELGSEHWIIPLVKAKALDEWLAWLPKFREMREDLAGVGLTLAYHNHEMELQKLDGKYVMEHLLDAMPELKAQFHIAQFLPERGVSLPDWIRKYEDQVISLHVNDGTADGPARLGEGDCKAVESIRAAIDAGVTNFIIEEDFTPGNLDDVKRDLDVLLSLLP